MTRRRDIVVADSHQGATAAPSDTSLAELGREIMRRAAPVLRGAGIDTYSTVCRLEPAPTRLNVRFEVPAAVAPATKQALAVRVLDAVRSAGRTFGAVDVSVQDSV
jgi:hypothetical protein